jgi:hypothetical protein
MGLRRFGLRVGAAGIVASLLNGMTSSPEGAP